MNVLARSGFPGHQCNVPTANVDLVRCVSPTVHRPFYCASSDSACYAPLELNCWHKADIKSDCLDVGYWG